VIAERAVSRTLGGSCSMPLAAHARWHGQRLELHALVGHPERHASPLLRASSTSEVADASGADALGRRCGQALIDAGAASYLGLPVLPTTGADGA
jgi:hydroxymethylbilane synthase